MPKRCLCILSFVWPSLLLLRVSFIVQELLEAQPCLVLGLGGTSRLTGHISQTGLSTGQIGWRTCQTVFLSLLCPPGHSSLCCSSRGLLLQHLFLWSLFPNDDIFPFCGFSFLVELTLWDSSIQAHVLEKDSDQPALHEEPIILCLWPIKFVYA